MNQTEQMRKHILDLLNAVCKACGDNEKVVKATIKSQGGDYKAIKQALAHVNETPKNEHDSGDVLNKSGNVGVMREVLQSALEALEYDDFTPEDFGHKKACELAKIQIRAFLAAEKPLLVRLTDEDIKVLQAFHNFNVCTTSDKDLVTFAHAIQNAMQEKNK